MKKNLFLTIFTAQLLCLPTVHAAASKGATAYEQYENALTNANTNAIVAAFLDLPQSDQRSSHHLARLTAALIKEKHINPMYIDALEHTFSSDSPLIKWLRSRDAEPSQELLAYLNIGIDSLSAPTQASAPAPIISEKGDELRTPAPLRQLAEKHTSRTVEQAQPSFAQLITPDMLKLIKSGLTVRLVDAQEADVWNTINNLTSVMDIKITNTAIAQNLFKKVATQIARDAYLQLRKERQLSPEEGYNQLSPFLKAHFKGVSVQDLIDNDLLPATNDGLLRLNNHFINNLTGLKNIPDINNLDSLILSDNLITEITPGSFKGLIELQRLYLTNNQVTVIAPGAFAGLTALESLDLGLNQIAEIAPGTFADLINLQSLFLAGNLITEIAPGTFTDLTSLQSLLLNSNQITGIASGAFTGLTSLQRLYLHENQITGITSGAFTGLISLKTLKLEKNKIITIAPKAFTGLISLQVLILENNKIITIAPNAFTGLISLQVLSLRNNLITEIASGAFTGLTALEHLDLNNNLITEIAPGAFTGLMNLQIIGLHNNQITGIAPRTFTGLTSLQRLYLSYNPITEPEQQQISDEIKAFAPEAKIVF